MDGKNNIFQIRAPLSVWAAGTAAATHEGLYPLPPPALSAQDRVSGLGLKIYEFEKFSVNIATFPHKKISTAHYSK